MTSPQSATSELSPGGAPLSTVRHYLAQRWILLALGGGLALVLGLYLGGWGWLVAIGAAPLILSTLPCLIMCGLGVCMACRSTQKNAATAAADVGMSAAALTATEVPLTAGLSCCHADAGENSAIALVNNSAPQQKEKSHA